MEEAYTQAMYMVVSKWEFDLAHEQEVKSSAGKMMATINSWSEVEFAYNVRVAPNAVLAVIAYQDEPSYTRLIHDPDGPFAKAVSEHRIEDHSKWVWSEGGEVEAL